MQRFLALIAIPLLACVALARLRRVVEVDRLVILIRVLLLGREHGRHRNRSVRQDAEGDHPEGQAG